MAARKWWILFFVVLAVRLYFSLELPFSAHVLCSLLAVGLAFGGTSLMDLALCLLALQTEMTANADEIEMEEEEGEEEVVVEEEEEDRRDGQNRTELNSNINIRNFSTLTSLRRMSE